MKPFFKYAGGKRKLAPYIVSRILEVAPACYVETFVGGGAVFLALREAGFKGPAVLNDLSPVIATVWQVVKAAPHDVVDAFHAYAQHDSREFYYEVRGAQPVEAVALAAWFLYINKAGFNGLWRVNRAGACNVPYGDGRPPALDAAAVYAASLALRGVEVCCGDFAEIDCGVHTVAYCDPPYLPLSATASFTGYAAGGFSAGDQLRLAAWAQAQVRRRVSRVIVSNAGNEDAVMAFRNTATITVEVTASRVISCKANGRQPVKEHLFIYE